MAAREAIRRAKVDPGRIDRALFGNVLADSTGGSPAAAACRAAGLPRGVMAITYRMGCASGLGAVAAAVEAIASGRARVVLAGGFESSSKAPHLAHGIRAGMRLGGGKLLDSARHDGPGAHDPSPAEELAGLQALRREGGLDGQIVQLDSPNPRKGRPRTVEQDDEPAEGGGRPPLADGAAALVLASGPWAGRQGLRPLATLEIPEDPLDDAGGMAAIHADLPEQGWKELRRRSGAGCQINPAGGGGALGHAAGADGARLAVSLAHSPAPDGGSGIMAVAGDGHGVILAVTRRT